MLREADDNAYPDRRFEIQTLELKVAPPIIKSLQVTGKFVFFFKSEYLEEVAKSRSERPTTADCQKAVSAYFTCNQILFFWSCRAVLYIMSSRR